MPQVLPTGLAPSSVITTAQIVWDVACVGLRQDVRGTGMSAGLGEVILRVSESSVIETVACTSLQMSSPT